MSSIGLVDAPDETYSVPAAPVPHAVATSASTWKLPCPPIGQVIIGNGSSWPRIEVRKSMAFSSMC
jgi:hypothetical protein